MIGDNGQGYGLTLIGGGTFVFSGGSGNTYTGATTLVAGTLELSKTVQNAIPAALIIGNGVSKNRPGDVERPNCPAAPP